MNDLLLMGLVLLDIKTTLSQGFNNYVMPTTGAAMGLTFIVFAIRNFNDFKDEFWAALVKCAAWGLLVGVVTIVLIGIVEAMKGVKVTF